MWTYDYRDSGVKTLFEQSVVVLRQILYGTKTCVVLGFADRIFDGQMKISTHSRRNLFELEHISAMLCHHTACVEGKRAN